MMCSSWKISVFGILALMLAFGLATSDAGAAGSDVIVTVSAINDTSALKAAEEGRILQIQLSLASSDNGTAATKDGTIEITPTGSGWASPRLVNADGELAGTAAAEAVAFDTGGDGPTPTVSRGKLIANVKSGYDSTITWQYKTNVPAKAANYKFRIRSTVHKDNGPNVIATNITGTGLVDSTATSADNGHNIVIIVGAAKSGSGTFALTTSGIPNGADDYKNADGTDGDPDGADDLTDYNHAKKYFVPAEKEYTLAFTYTAAGTMHKGSVIRFTIPQDNDSAEGFVNWPLMTDGTGAGNLTVSGATLYSFRDNDSDPNSNTALAFLSSRVEKGHRVTFTYKAKTPKVTASSADSYLFSAHSNSLASENKNVSLRDKPADVGWSASTHQVGGTATSGVTFVVVQGQGGGELTVTPVRTRDSSDPPQYDADHTTNISASTDKSLPANLVLTFTAAGRMLQGSQVTVAVPDGWTPAPRTSRVAGSSSNGMVEAALGGNGCIKTRRLLPLRIE